MHTACRTRTSQSVVFQTMVLLSIALLLTACSASQSGAAGAVESYIEALIAQDEAQVANLSCTAWEASARSELDSFTAVTVELQDLACQESGAEGEFSLVTCSGIISANYGNEVLEIDLSDRTYQAVSQAGEWRMCGYR